MSVIQRIQSGTLSASQTETISSDYLTLTPYNHGVENNIKVHVCYYSYAGVDFYRDISAEVISYSYSCNFDDNIHQSASITLHVETDDQFGYMLRENKIAKWYGDSMVAHYAQYMKYIYRIIKTYYDPDTERASEIDLGYFYPVNNDYTYNPTTGELTINLQGLSCILTKEYGGSVLSFRTSKTVTDPETGQSVTKTMPTTISIDSGISIDNKMFYELAMGSYAHDVSLMDITAFVPLVGATIRHGQTFYQTADDIDFDADVGRMDMIQEVMDFAFVGATAWVDENRFLNISSKPQERSKADLIAHWKDYGYLFLSESVSYDDSGYYNVTEVYGKDNNCYGMYEEIILDGYVRKQIIQVSELQTDEECRARAKWETHKSLYGHQHITVTLVDRYIPQFTMPSLQVGRMIEYANVDGDINLYFLDSLSTDGNTWTMNLTLFKPLYETDITDNTYMLATPMIYKHEVINGNTLRLYVNGEDIEYGLVKLFGGQQTIDSVFVDVSVETLDNGDKIIDYPIDSNGTYYFYVQLYSPLHEDSAYGGSDTSGDTLYIAEVTGVTTEAITTDPDPYPHPNMFVPQEAHEPYLTTHQGVPITTTDGDVIII